MVVNAGEIDLTGLRVEQINTDIGGPKNAIDRIPLTASLTQVNCKPWWMIDLGATYNVKSVNIKICTYPEFRNYRYYFLNSLTDRLIL